MTDSTARLLATDNRLLKRSCESLIGICAGLIADGDLNDKEIIFLSTWLTQNQEISRTWPGEVIYHRIREVLSDGEISPDERLYLIQTLEGLCGGSFSDTGGIASGSNTLPVNPDAVVVVEKRAFCFTGQFVFGTRSACERAVTNRGGLACSGVTKKTDYLVVGDLASKDWKHLSHGLKIEQAVSGQSRGFQVVIVDEVAWLRALS